ncbi:MAG: DUF1853 family protein [Cryomorphaceae bacterium]
MSNDLHTAFSHGLRMKGFLDSPSLFAEALPDGTRVFHAEPSGGVPDESDIDEGGAVRLGHMAERYFAAWLAAHPRYESRVQNLQVISDGRTLGEIDFIVDDLRAGETLHIELAYKIYVLRISDGGAEWVGPNGKDSLRGKLQKLRSRQFPLVAHPICRKALDAIGIASEALRPAACIKGQLYVPRGYQGPLPDGLNHEAVAGSVMTRDEFAAREFDHCSFFSPSGADRLVHPRLIAGQDVGWTDKTGLMRTWAETDRAAMVWVRDAEGGNERAIVI